MEQRRSWLETDVWGWKFLVLCCREIESSVARCSASIRMLLMTAVFHVCVALVWLCIHHMNVFG